MNYTLESLDAAILVILPISAKFPTSIIGGIHRASKIMLCVKAIFMYPENYKSQESLMAVETIRSAMIDLSETGSLNYE